MNLTICYFSLNQSIFKAVETQNEVLTKKEISRDLFYYKSHASGVMDTIIGIYTYLTPVQTIKTVRQIAVAAGAVSHRSDLKPYRG